jgi:hypothetical protein
MIKSEIIAMQERIGASPDGFWGPKSIAACKAHLRGMMPSPNPWPPADQASLKRFYGEAGDESRLVRFELPRGTLYDGMTARHARANERCFESLSRVLRAIAETPHAWVLAEYAGIYQDRPMRGGSLPSLHARGAAIDLAPNSNCNHKHWPSNATMPLEVMELFAKEGWLAAGAFWSRDAMHFQATM